jgi:hypothetical protein
VKVIGTNASSWSTPHISNAVPVGPTGATGVCYQEGVAKFHSVHIMDSKRLSMSNDTLQVERLQYCQVQTIGRLPQKPMSFAEKVRHPAQLMRRGLTKDQIYWSEARWICLHRQHNQIAL